VMIKLRLGASLVQLYTSLALEGPLLPQRILHDLAEAFTIAGTTASSGLGAPVKSFDQAYR